MDLDQMLETWRAQNTAPPYEVNRDALRQALQTEEARVRGELRVRRWIRWFLWISGTGMAVWAGFWIAITITNGWPAIYAIACGVSFGLFALGAGALWMSRGREPERNFANSLEEEVRRSLALVDYQLSDTRRQILFTLGAASIAVTTMLFTWTVNRSQDIPTIHRSPATAGRWPGSPSCSGGLSTGRASGCARRGQNWSSASGVCARCSPLSRTANDRRVTEWICAA